MTKITKTKLQGPPDKSTESAMCAVLNPDVHVQGAARGGGGYGCCVGRKDLCRGGVRAVARGVEGSTVERV